MASKYVVLDRYGFPVEVRAGHPIQAFLRRCIHGRRIVRRSRLWKITTGSGATGYMVTKAKAHHDD